MCVTVTLVTILFLKLFKMDVLGLLSMFVLDGGLGVKGRRGVN